MSCCRKGPGYASPAEAIKGPKESLLYTVLIYSGTEQPPKPDCLATIDCDRDSPTYSQVLSKLEMPYPGDELHHFGWNTCSSCCNDASKVRRFLILPGFKSSRIYVVDTIEPKRPKIHKILEPSEIVDKWGLRSPHTVHCLASGEVMISFLGDENGNAPGGFLLLDESFNVKGKWAEIESKKMSFNYDFWYQPFHNIMISSTWSCPNVFVNGFNPEDVKEKYGHEIFLWDWKDRKIVKKFDLGDEGRIPLELRFHHDPKSTHGFVGAALSSAIFHWWKDGDDWKIEKAIQVDAVELAGWPFPVPGLITDILISMDDRFLYFSDWLHGDIRQYDIRDPSKPKLVGQIWCGGLIGGEKTPLVKGNKLRGGPQMLQLSLDGKRLYVTNSLFSSWDDQFYPDIGKSGSHLIKIDVDNENGGMKLDESFFVEFNDGPYRAHETRYPGGDCSSDIFLAE